MEDSVIIYGGAGFIGSHIVDDLIKYNFNITIFDKFQLSKTDNDGSASKLEFINGDFNNITDIKQSLEGKDYVVHLISSTTPSSSNINKVYDVETNLVSTLNLLEECVKKKVKKIIFVSSGGTVYGRTNEIPIKEDHPTNPLCSYGIVKLSIEKYLELYKNLHGLNYTILRFSNPFGEKQKSTSGQGFIITALDKILKRDIVEVWGDGNVIRDYIYVKDAAKSIYLSIATKTKYDIFNISNNKGYSINDILDIFRKTLQLSFNVKYISSRNYDVPINILSNERAIEFLKWKPITSLEDAICKTWEHVNKK